MQGVHAGYIQDTYRQRCDTGDTCNVDGYIRNASSAATDATRGHRKPTDADVPSLEEEGNAALDASLNPLSTS